jgi:hypothetical protein
MQTGYKNEILLKAMNPTKWAAVRAQLSEFSGPEGESKAILAPPQAYLDYADLSLVLHLGLRGSNGPLTGKEVASSIVRLAQMPQPIRILRMYAKDGTRANCVRLVYKTRAEVDKQRNYKIQVGPDACKVSQFRTAPLLAPRGGRRGKKE